MTSDAVMNRNSIEKNFRGIFRGIVTYASRKIMKLEANFTNKKSVGAIKQIGTVRFNAKALEKSRAFCFWLSGCVRSDKLTSRRFCGFFTVLARNTGARYRQKEVACA
jgi:hypothetical protein